MNYVLFLRKQTNSISYKQQTFDVRLEINTFTLILQRDVQQTENNENNDYPIYGNYHIAT